MTASRACWARLKAPGVTQVKLLIGWCFGIRGRRLCPALERTGHSVRAMTRHLEDYHGAGERSGLPWSIRSPSSPPRRECDVA